MFNDASMEVGATAITDDITHVQLHSTGAVTSSASECSVDREPVTWTVDANGDASFGPITFTGGTPTDPIVRVGYWTALTGGEYRGGALLSGSQEFDGDGEYTVTLVTESASSS